MKILVTGATGFVGKYVVKELIKKGYHLYCIVRDKNKLLNSFNVSAGNISFEEIYSPEDLSSDQLKALIEENGIDTIVHNAALAREYHVSWEEYVKVNVEWTKKLALGFINSEAEHNRFIYISTVGVYGTTPGICPANEDTFYNPDGKYHKSKMLAEKELIKLRDSFKLPLIILRPSIMYGDGDYGFLQKLFKLTSKGVFPLSTKNHKIHLLDLETFAKSIEFGMNSINASNYIYNVADKNPVYINELLEIIKGYTDGGYVKIPSFMISALKNLSIFHPALNIKFKLIGDSWFYDVNRIANDYGVSLKDTFTNLGKYVAWYKGAINGNK